MYGSVEKNIFVIDDKGDTTEFLYDLFRDDSVITIISTKSDSESLKKSFDRFSYLIIINQDDLKKSLTELIRFFNDNMFYLTIPVVILSSDEEVVKNRKILDIPIFNYISKPLNSVNFKKFLEYIIEVCDYNKNINDISGLPGNRVIDYKVRDEIDKNSKFSLVYLDLDNFKEFGEHYGLYRGSQVILLLSNILNKVIRTYGDMEDFIGHIGGDDFILVLKDYKSAKKICDEIIKEFDEKIIKYYDEEDLERGYFEAINRAGEDDKISIMGISIVMMDYTEFVNTTYDEVYKKMMKIKRKAKMVEGSVVLSNKS